MHTIGTLIDALKRMVDSGEADLDSPVLVSNDEFGTLYQLGIDDDDSDTYFYSDVSPLTDRLTAEDYPLCARKDFVERKGVVLNHLMKNQKARGEADGNR